jgi:hypothetical protein
MLMCCATDIRLYHVITTAMGVSDDIRDWQAEFDDGGASYYFNLTKAQPDLLPYETRWNMLHYVVGESSKLRYLCRILFRCMYSDVDEGELAHKLLIFCNWPIEQWLISFFLDLLCLQYSELKAGQGVSEKHKIMMDFNDPDSPIRLCVTSFKNTAVGVNMHKACHRIVMLSIPENVNTLLQCIGRVHRIGQLLIQLIWILGLEGTYDLLLQHKMVEKYRGEILAQGKLTGFDWTSPEGVDRLSKLKEQRAKVEKEQDRAKSDEWFARQIGLVEDAHLDPQVSAIITRLLGFRRLPVDFKENEKLVYNPPHVIKDPKGEGLGYPPRRIVNFMKGKGKETTRGEASQS